MMTGMTNLEPPVEMPYKNYPFLLYDTFYKPGPDAKVIDLD